MSWTNLALDPYWAAAKGDWLGIQRYKHICCTCWCWEVTRGHLHGRPGKTRQRDKFLSEHNPSFEGHFWFWVWILLPSLVSLSSLQKYSRHFQTSGTLLERRTMVHPGPGSEGAANSAASVPLDKHIWWYACHLLERRGLLSKDAYSN